MLLRPCFALLLLAPLPAFAASYLIDVRHTQGVVSWNHLGFANPTAKFTQVSGELEFDSAAPAQAKVKAVIPLTQLATGIPDLDEDFRSEAFFDFNKFPTATFTAVGAKPGAKPGQFTLEGTLDLHGVSQPVTLAVTLNKIGTNPRSGLPEVGFQAHGTLKRSAFGLGKFVPQVSDEITLDLTVEAIETKSYAVKLKEEEAAETIAHAKFEAERIAAAEAALAEINHTAGDKPAH